jgi:hypothetical protein
LKTYPEVTEVKEEFKMAKKKVKFTLSDGVAPLQSEEPGRPFLLKMPINITIPSRVDSDLDLGVAVDRACVVVRGSVCTLFAPNTKLSVKLVNPAAEVLVMGRGETVARLFVLDNSDLVME